MSPSESQWTLIRNHNGLSFWYIKTALRKALFEGPFGGLGCPSDRQEAQTAKRFAASPLRCFAASLRHLPALLLQMTDRKGLTVVRKARRVILGKLRSPFPHQLQLLMEMTAPVHNKATTRARARAKRAKTERKAMPRRRRCDFQDAKNERLERIDRSDDPRRQAFEQVGEAVTVRKHSSMGCAVVSMTDVEKVNPLSEEKIAQFFDKKYKDIIAQWKAADEAVLVVSRFRGEERKRRREESQKRRGRGKKKGRRRLGKEEEGRGKEGKEKERKRKEKGKEQEKKREEGRGKREEEEGRGRGKRKREEGRGKGSEIQSSLRPDPRRRRYEEEELQSQAEQLGAWGPRQMRHGIPGTGLADGSARPPNAGHGLGPGPQRWGQGFRSWEITDRPQDQDWRAYYQQ
eukprot:Skav216113  [mRNA]  locus=scaffold1946:122652:129010:+ [translate_table: standard]